MQQNANQIQHKTIENTITFSFCSDPFAVRDVLSELHDTLLQKNVAESDVENADIVLGEALNNIVEHAYPDGKSGDIKLQYTVDAGFHTIAITDNGLAMPDLTPPEGAAKPDDCAFEELPEGGFGWFMIRALTQNLSYQRHEGTNRLQFILSIEEN